MKGLIIYTCSEVTDARPIEDSTSISHPSLDMKIFFLILSPVFLPGLVSLGIGWTTCLTAHCPGYCYASYLIIKYGELTDGQAMVILPFFRRIDIHRRL